MQKFVTLLVVFSFIGVISCRAFPQFDYSDDHNHDQIWAVGDRESKRNGFGFSQGAGYDSRNKLKDLLRIEQQQQKAETEYMNQWNRKFEELFGKGSSNSDGSQDRSRDRFKKNDQWDGFQVSLRQVFGHD